MVNVVVGVLKKNNKFLIAQRAKGSHQELKWEFPGGKIEDNETEQEALCREFFEEFSVHITVKDFICELKHQYPAMKVNLKVYYVESKENDFKINVHKTIEWVQEDELPIYDFVSGNYPIIERVVNKHVD